MNNTSVTIIGVNLAEGTNLPDGALVLDQVTPDRLKNEALKSKSGWQG